MLKARLWNYNRFTAAWLRSESCLVALKNTFMGWSILERNYYTGNAWEQTTLASTRVLSRCAKKATAESCIKFKLKKTLLDCSPVSMEENNLFWTLKYLVLAAIYSHWRTLWTFCAPLQLQLRSCTIRAWPLKRVWNLCCQGTTGGAQGMCDVESPAITAENGKVRQRTPVSLAAGQSHCRQLRCFSGSLLLLCGLFYSVVAKAEWRRTPKMFWVCL